MIGVRYQSNAPTIPMHNTFGSELHTGRLSTRSVRTSGSQRRSSCTTWAAMGTRTRRRAIPRTSSRLPAPWLQRSGIRLRAWVKSRDRNSDAVGCFPHRPAPEVGTLLLWLLWPSFNAAVAGSPEAENLAIANTFVSLCGCPEPRERPHLSHNARGPLFHFGNALRNFSKSQ